MPADVEVRLPVIEIRDTAENRLVTSIEILSPVNKREPGLQRYRSKRLRRAGVHLLEIDLLRRGTRSVVHPRIPDCAYLVALTRVESSNTEVWPLGLRDCLPSVPVPLIAPDDDVGLELGAALATIYDEAAYELSIDYAGKIPPPRPGEQDLAWIRELVR